MAKLYTKQTWTDEVLADSEKYKIKNDAGVQVYAQASIELATAVVQAGTAVNAARLNHIEDGLDAVDSRANTLLTSKMDTPGVAGTAGQALVQGASAPEWKDQEFTIQVILGDGVNVLSTGLKGFLEVPFACVISAVRVVADAVGSCVIDIWKDTYANFPPTVADTITASAKPTLSSAQKAENTTLTGWTKSLAKGDWLAFNVDSATTVKQVTLSITGKKA